QPYHLEEEAVALQARADRLHVLLRRPPAEHDDVALAREGDVLCSGRGNALQGSLQRKAAPGAVDETECWCHSRNLFAAASSLSSDGTPSVFAVLLDRAQP